MPHLSHPTGTVTFLFTDIERSTRLLETLGTDEYARILGMHQRIVRDAIASSDGTEVLTEGDSFFAVFTSATGAVKAAVAAQRDLAAADWAPAESVRVRMGIHTGEGRLAADGGGYVGIDVHRAARIAAAGHGGQVLLSGTVLALIEHELPELVTVRDLGEHRLKDLPRPEHISQLVIDGLADRFPALSTIEATPNNLPPQLTSFLGRTTELDDVLGLIGASRLITLTGPGGTGKTRLSLEVAARARGAFPDGVFFVALAPIRDPGLVATTIAHALGLPDGGSRSAIARVLDHLRDRRVLLVIDNFEQLTEAASVVSELLAGAPRLSTLITSRGSLHLYGEREYPVPPLDVADPAQHADPTSLARSEAVRLFVDRASAVRPGFALTAENTLAVAEICYRLDGLPLAIELVAARIRLLSPQAILARLGNRLDLLGGGAQDLPARQRTLRAAIAWSHDMLGPPERSLFACLSVFVGGAAIDAVESVCADGADHDVLDSMTSLVDKALVRQADGVAGEARMEMLQTIREFAWEQLDSTPDAEAVRERHVALYLALAEEASGRLMSSGKRVWLDRLDEEHDNLRAALAFCLEREDAEPSLRMCIYLWRFWQMRGYLTEGSASMNRALALPGATADPDLHLRAVESAAGLAYWMGELLEARRLYQETLRVNVARGERIGEANALYNLSFTYMFLRTRDVDEGGRLGREALAIFRDAGDRSGEARALWSLANWAQGSGRPDALILAREYGREALAVFTELDDAFLTGWALYNLAEAEFLDGGDLDLIPKRLTDALRIFTQAEDVSGYTLVLDALAAYEYRTDDRLRSARISGAVETLERQSGTGLNPINRQLMGFDPALLRKDPACQTAWAEGARMPLADVIEFALASPVRSPVTARVDDATAGLPGNPTDNRPG